MTHTLPTIKSGDSGIQSVGIGSLGIQSPCHVLCQCPEQNLANLINLKSGISQLCKDVMHKEEEKSFFSAEKGNFWTGCNPISWINCHHVAANLKNWNLKMMVSTGNSI
jgi:hypothetical protein